MFEIRIQSHPKFLHPNPIRNYPTKIGNKYHFSISSNVYWSSHIFRGNTNVVALTIRNLKTHSLFLPVDRLQHGWTGQLEHGFWQPWTWLLAALNMVLDSLEHGCWQVWTWLLTALKWLLKGFNMHVVDRLEHGCWQLWTWLLKILNMIVDKLEHGYWQAWTLLLTSLDIVVDRREHGCWQPWTLLLTGLNMVVDSLVIFSKHVSIHEWFASEA